MYYIIRIDAHNFVGKACGQMASQENAFKFTSLLHAQSVLASWRANHPNARLLEVNEGKRCVTPVIDQSPGGLTVTFEDEVAVQ